MSRVGEAGRRLTAAAERAVGAGFLVFPVRPRAKTPAVPGWEQAATRDLGQVARWWRRAPFNVGLAVGRSRVVVIDLDRPKPESASPVASNGRDALRRLADHAQQVIPATASVRTPSGGTHLYFRMPDGVELRNSQGLLAPLIDTRGSGGYVLAAGSTLASGRYVADGGQIALLPAWLTSLLLPPRPIAPEAELGLSSTRATAYVNAIVASETAAIVNAAVGTRHTTRLRAARSLGRLVAGGELDFARARWALLEAAQSHLGVDTTAREIERDVNDGLAYGARRPRRISRSSAISDDIGHGKASDH
ncbi:bifunctional DNA primase/polymerase [Pseudonocardia oroxyli]|uniref:Bifunctional DNA primase/polymerase, N-terminal n=1 Tax=Pseudonocardia oroxyli TaxID=366584 RepID=A0A1G7IT12_PSEOR|nr:bifunctional DNA primase/polymerase [Pseudonocardia oroxyli]SDF15735.1 Bifunctional DNA primase/polymerase, N-terminal [Pseudonocardia oroxyli]